MSVLYQNPLGQTFRDLLENAPYPTDVYLKRNGGVRVFIEEKDKQTNTYFPHSQLGTFSTFPGNIPSRSRLGEFLQQEKSKFEQAISNIRHDEKFKNIVNYRIYFAVYGGAGYLMTWAIQMAKGLHEAGFKTTVQSYETGSDLWFYYKEVVSAAQVKPTTPEQQAVEPYRPY